MVGRRKEARKGKETPNKTVPENKKGARDHTPKRCLKKKKKEGRGSERSSSAVCTIAPPSPFTQTTWGSGYIPKQATHLVCCQMPALGATNAAAVTRTLTARFSLFCLR